MAHRRSTRLDGCVILPAAQWRSISRRTLSGRRNSAADRLIISVTTLSADGNAAAVSIADIWHTLQTHSYNSEHYTGITVICECVIAAYHVTQGWKKSWFKKQEIWANAHETRHSISLILYVCRLGLSHNHSNFVENSLYKRSKWTARFYIFCSLTLKYGCWY